MPRVMTIYGTRPEAIKVAPVIRSLAESPALSTVTVVTGQHREMLDQMNKAFGITPDYDLDVFEHGQTLNALMAKVFDRLDPLLDFERPDAVLVQGDTSTVAAAAIASFYRQIPVFHLEAGLRSGDINSPFPEEANRKLATQVTSLHLAPTSQARVNLMAEGVDPGHVVVTGNTVIDALLHIIKQDVRQSDARLRGALSSGRPILLVTTHRRESWGGALEGVGRALRRIACAFPAYVIVLPAHRNPVVRDAVLPHLSGLDNVLVTEPLPYAEFVAVLGKSHIVLTDSGGIQEEAPSLGKPVLVMRENTERPEAVDAGAVRLVGTDEERIFIEFSTLAMDSDHYARMSSAVNPYGDGQAALRVTAAVENFFGIGNRMPDFSAHASGK